jgi:hypothetical protein
MLYVMRKYFWTPVFFVLLFACSGDDSDQLDTINPNISILSGLAPGEELKGTTLVEFSASDEGGIGSVIIDLDGTETFTLESPFSWTFETTDYADGSHSISAIAVDLAGNESEPLNVEFTIENTFLILTVGDNYLSGSMNYFFVTNEMNAVVVVSQIENGQQYEFQRPPGFNADTYNYHLVSTSQDELFGLVSVVNENRNMIMLERAASSSFDNGAELGQANINLINIPRHDYYAFYPALALNQDFDLNGRDFNTTLFENTKSYYLYLIDGNTGLFMEGELQVGQNTLDLSNLSSEMDPFTFRVGHGIAQFTVTARDTRNMNQYKPFLLAFHGPIWTGSDSELVFHLPSERSHFHDYYITSSFFDPNNELDFTSTAFSENSLLLPTAINATINDASFQIDDIDVDVSGTFDNLTVLSNSMVNGDSFFWRVQMKNGGEDIDVFPEIPSMIRTNHPAFVKSAFENIERFTITLSEGVETESTREVRSVRKRFE